MNTIQNQTRYIGSTATISLQKGDDTYSVHREFWFDEDTDGTWLVLAMRSEAPEAHGDRPGGSIRVDSPAVRGFLEDLFRMLADPEGFGDFEQREDS